MPAVACLSLCSLLLAELGSTVVRTRWPTGAGVLFDRFSFIVRLYFQQCQLSRRNGPPGVSTGYFQRTIVRYTEFDHMTDRGLCPVLRTRPGLAPPQICLPSTFRYGTYLYVDPRFCLRLPSGAHCCNTLLTGVASAKRVAFSYPSPPPGWIWTLPDTRVIIPDITI